MSITERLRGILRQTPLEQKIIYALYELEKVHKSLETESTKLLNKADSLFQRCVRAQEMKDVKTATLYANECAKVREMSLAVLQSQIAIEQAMLRLETVKYLRDLVAQMEPIRPLIQRLSQKLSTILPSASITLARISALLNELAIDAGEAIEYKGPIGNPIEDAERILKDATALAEQKMKETFPSLDKFQSQ